MTAIIIGNKEKDLKREYQKGVDYFIANKPLSWEDILRAEAARMGRLDFIRYAVQLYSKTFRVELDALKINNKAARSSRANKFASLNGFRLDMRWAVSAPRRLVEILDLILNPRMFYNTKELHWFMKTFPDFCIPEKV